MDGMRSGQVRGGALRDGFTLIEVLVVSAIAAILVSLVAVGVQSARGSARRVQCVHNLHQWGLAYHQYHDVHGALPNKYVYLRYMLGGGKYVDPGIAYYGYHLPNMDVAVCPADDLINRQEYEDRLPAQGQISYPANGTFRVKSTPTGLTLVASGLVKRWRDVSDGLSTTALASEKLVYALTPAAIRRDRPLRSPWAMSPRLANPIVEPALMQELCRERATYPLLGEWGPTQQLADERRYYAYDHAMVPNSISCTDRSTPLDNTRVELPAAATSAHGGGVNLLMCDGSVSFVSESIAVNVWWAKGTADGAETTGVD